MIDIPQPGEDEPLSVECARSVDRLCDRFETAWQQNQRPTLESFLAEAPPHERSAALVELLSLEIEYRRLHGETPRPDEYPTRLGVSAEIVTAVFRRLAGLASEQPATGVFLPNATTADLEVGRTWRAPALPGYEILDQLGAGGMGVVYKARQQSLNRIVALKFIRPDLFAGTRERQRFRREAEIAARLRHPHVIQVYEIGDHEGQPYAVLEYVEGRTLARLLAEGSSDLRPAVSLLAKIARAVHHAHETGVLHRDLKPTNVLIDADGVPKVADFGLARWIGGPSEHTINGEILGTPNYMAPEQASGQAEKLSPATDVHALGAILYEILTGQPPFRGPTALDTLEQVRSREPALPRRAQAQVPRDLATICLKCLEKEPARRYASALQLAEDLERWLRHEPIVARPQSWPERGLRLLRKHRSALAVLLMLGLAVLGFVVLPVVLQGPSPEVREARRQQTALQALEADLAAGRGVDLIGPTGPPGYFQWQTSADRQQIFPNADAPVVVSTNGHGVLELAPDPGSDEYALSAEVRQETAQGFAGMVGLYFAHTRFPWQGGVGHCFFELEFNDLADEATIHPEQHLPGNKLRLIRRVLLEPLKGSGGAETSIHCYFPPIGRQGELRWRKLRIELRRKDFKVYWDGKLAGQMSRDELLTCTAPAQKHFHVPEIPIDLRGGLGLYVNRSSAAFRRVRLEPIVDHERRPPSRPGAGV